MSMSCWAEKRVLDGVTWAAEDLPDGQSFCLEYDDGVALVIPSSALMPERARLVLSERIALAKRQCARDGRRSELRVLRTGVGAMGYTIVAMAETMWVCVSLTARGLFPSHHSIPSNGSDGARLTSVPVEHPPENPC